MIALTRISGQPFVLNCDLIERVDSTADTVITLVDGKKYVVLESPTAVTEAIRRHRSEIITLSRYLQPVDVGLDADGHCGEPTPSVPHLSPVTPISREV